MSVGLWPEVDEPNWLDTFRAHFVELANTQRLSREVFSSPRHVRVLRIQELLGAGRLDGALRWIGAEGR